MERSLAADGATFTRRRIFSPTTSQTKPSLGSRSRELGRVSGRTHVREGVTYPQWRYLWHQGFLRTSQYSDGSVHVFMLHSFLSSIDAQQLTALVKNEPDEVMSREGSVLEVTREYRVEKLFRLLQRRRRCYRVNQEG